MPRKNAINRLHIFYSGDYTQWSDHHITHGEASRAFSNNVRFLGHGLRLECGERSIRSVYNRMLLEAVVMLPLEAELIFAPGDEMIHEGKIAKTGNVARVISYRSAPELPEMG